jgi:hypothetical protein
VRGIWTICACAAGVAALAAAQLAEFPVQVVLTALLTLVLTWL